MAQVGDRGAAASAQRAERQAEPSTQPSAHDSDEETLSVSDIVDHRLDASGVGL